MVGVRRFLPHVVAVMSLAGLGVAACGETRGRHAEATRALSAPTTVAGRAASTSETAARLLFAGDVMLGRGVAKIAAADADGLFAEIRFEVASADIAVANLESPLTSRPHDPAFGPNALEAPPASPGCSPRRGSTLWASRTTMRAMPVRVP